MKEPAIALDIGSTNIQGFLVDVKKKKELAYANTSNSLARHGKDIVTRFTHSFSQKEASKKILSNLRLYCGHNGFDTPSSVYSSMVCVFGFVDIYMV